MPTPVDVQNFDSTTPGSTPTGWVLGSGSAVTNVGAAAKSGTNVLSSTSTGSVVSYPTTQDSNTGKTSWAFSLKIVGTQAGGASQYCIMQFRLVSPPATWASNTCYAVYFVPTGTAGSCQVYLVKRISGTETGIGSTVSIPYASGAGVVWNAWYDLLITADEVGANTSITVQIRRANGDYLDSTGAWQSTQNFIISATSNVSALKANSNVGMLLSASGTTGTYFDSSDYESLAAGSTAWTQTCTETLSLTDTRKMAAVRGLAETLTLTDTRFGSVVKALAESLSLADSRASATGKALAEVLTLTDVESAAVGRLLSETLSLTDTRKASGGKGLAETLSLADSIANVSTFRRTLAENLVLTDARAAGLARKLSETYGLTDSVAAAIVVAATLIIITASAGSDDLISTGPGGLA